jgi:hypothetical protein
VAALGAAPTADLRACVHARAWIQHFLEPSTKVPNPRERGWLGDAGQRTKQGPDAVVTEDGDGGGDGGAPRRGAGESRTRWSSCLRSFFPGLQKGVDFGGLHSHSQRRKQPREAPAQFCSPAQTPRSGLRDSQLTARSTWLTASPPPPPRRREHEPAVYVLPTDEHAAFTGWVSTAGSRALSLFARRPASREPRPPRLRPSARCKQSRATSNSSIDSRLTLPPPASARLDQLEHRSTEASATPFVPWFIQ